ncbi:MAG TPA: PD-(D/E)XK nuclease family protein, partial [Thermoanaerobaculia bacterium]|nr:PD-(D/E)XK nuclease family protein [Thermoanaerobaculia bacterium]
LWDMTQSGGAAAALQNYDTRSEELQNVAAEIAALLAAGVEPKAIGIVARALDPYDAHLLARFAREHGFATTLRDEAPLLAHRIGRGVASLLRIRDRGFPRAEVLELVRDGLKTNTRIDVDRADAETRRARIAGGTSEELRSVRRRSSILDDYIALVSELEDLTARIDLGRMTSLFRLDTDTDLEAADAIDEIADLFKRASIWNKGLDIASIIDALEHVSLSPLPTAHCQLVWAGDVMRFRGRTFEHLFAVRMQDDLFPQRRNDDPLLPDTDRRILGIREIGDGADEERLLFRLLHDGTTKQLHFSYAGGDGFGKVLRASRFVRGLPLSTPEPRDHATAQPRQRALHLLVKSGTRSPFDGYLAPEILRERISVALRSVTPTQLEDFGECPQKFLLKHILGVVDIDDPERDAQIHHREKGNLDHRILERFYRGWTASADDLARLEELVDDEFAQLETNAPPFNRTVRAIEQRATKRNLRDFVVNDQIDLANCGLEPKFFEYRFGAKWRERGGADRDEPFMVDAGGIPVRVEGQIDRIDVGGNRFRIVDYKSGKALRHQNLGEKIDRGVRLQLALYAMAVSEFFGVDASRVSGTIKPLIIGDGKGKFAFELAEKSGGLHETLAIFINAIQQGRFPAFPNDRDDEFNSCKYCPVNHSCRTKHDAEEKYAVQQKHDPRTLLSERDE